MTDCGFTAVDVLRYARRIVHDGGDPEPCRMGAYCLRCCAALAKGDLDQLHGVNVWRACCYPPGMAPTDWPLNEAVRLIAEHDKGVAHDRAGALALLDRLLAEAGPWSDWAI